MQALDVLRQSASKKPRYDGAEAEVPLDGVVPPDARTSVVEPDAKGHARIHRIHYAIHVLQAWRERRRCKAIWVPGAPRYRHPEEALPSDFPEARDTYYQALDPDTFMTRLQHQRHQALQPLDTGMPHHPGVKILQRPQGWMRVSPLDRLPEPTNLAHLKAEMTRRWPMTSLLDVLQATELRVGLTPHGMDTGPRVGLAEATWPRRLLLCLFGLGTHTGLKRGCATPPEEQYHDLFYVRRRYRHPEAWRNAMAPVVNAMFRIRATHIGGEGTTAGASDAKQLGAWEQHLLTEWPLRYGGRGGMV
jgi:Tn3 transposase DDE domain